MSYLRQLYSRILSTSILVLVLAVSALAGDVPYPGPPPPGPVSPVIDALWNLVNYVVSQI